MNASIQTEGTYSPDALFSGDLKAVSIKATILTGQVITRGAVLGTVTASGKMILSLSAAGDGSQVPNAILAEDVDATAADVEAMVYLTGEFNVDALTIGTAHTAASIRQGLRERGIFI